MKTLKKIYVILFILICCMPLLLMPFFKNDTNIEKREFAKFPEFINNGRFNTDFSTEFENWFNDRLPLRAYLLSASNFVKTEVLKAPSSNVIVGQENWLFYNSETEDYLNSNELSNNDINSIGITLLLIEEEINKKGGNFSFVAIPNKSSVYDEYMPNNYKKSNYNNLTRINKKLDELNVTHVDMLKTMKENKEKGLYHKRDSHWNYQGALIGYNSIMESLNKEHKTYSDATYKIEKNWRGDLDKLLYPVGGFMDNQYIYNINYSPFKFEGASIEDSKKQLEIYMSDKEAGDDYFKSINNTVSDNKKLFMARDSFARALLPLFIDNYKEAAFKRTDNPDIVSIRENTDMVYEIVERNLNRIIETAPFLYAPIRENKNNIVQGEKILDCKYSIEGYGIRVYGVLDEEIDIQDGRIYIQVSNETTKKTFEAFPIFEDKLLDVNGTKGYSMFINPKDLLEGEYEISVIIGENCYPAGKIININK